MKEELKIKFEATGLHTTVQDGGRIGFMSLGIAQSGAMDISSMQQANFLVDNPSDSPVLEITYAGPSLHFNNSCQIALTGADLSPRLNDVPIEMYESIYVLKDSKLSFGKLNSGCRSYLAIRGAWQVKKWLDSCSAAPFYGHELTPESVFNKGDELIILPKHTIPERKLPKEDFSFDDVTDLSVVKGPEFDFLQTNMIKDLFEKVFEISNQSNRMGIRLYPNLHFDLALKHYISTAILPGTVQLSNGGQLILLMKDAQTMGGYPRILCLSHESQQKLAQMRPGKKIRFKLQEQ